MPCYVLQNNKKSYDSRNGHHRHRRLSDTKHEHADNGRDNIMYISWRPFVRDQIIESRRENGRSSDPAPYFDDEYWYGDKGRTV